MAASRRAWASLASPTCQPNGPGSARCSAFRRTDPHSNRVSANTGLRNRETFFCGAETKAPYGPLKIQSTACRDKKNARVPASSGQFAMNRKISVCVRLRGGRRSRLRTGLRPKFPANREKCREIHEIVPWAAVVFVAMCPTLGHFRPIAARVRTRNL
jgi:hypothetical protein